MKFALILCIFLCTIGLSISYPQEGSLPEIDAFVQHLRNNRETLKIWLRNYLTSLKTEQKPFKLDPLAEISPRFSYIDCPTCLLAVPAARLAILLGLESVVKLVAVEICNSLNLIPPHGCDGLIEAFADPVLSILTLSPNTTGSDFCGILMGNSCAEINPEFSNWEVPIKGSKPQIKEPPAIPETVQRVTILQFTDVHVDLDYVEGSNSNCEGIVGCCRDGIGEGDFAAGKYGSNNCEMPSIGLEELFIEAQSKYPNPKFVFLTGDFIHSVLWTYSQQENTRVHSHVFNKIKEYFNSSIIFPVVGNHEPSPVNQFPPPAVWDQFDIGWVYTLVDQHFPDAVPEDQKEIFFKYGYYHTSPVEGLRLIMLNSNLCYTDNFWLTHEPIDPSGELLWLSKTLEAAESAREKVYIIGHVAPGSGGCWAKWSSVFDAIVNRYEAIIMGQFYGHGHDDEFKIHFEKDTERPTNVQYIAPSGTPDRGGYAFKAYKADGVREDATWEILDHEQWTMDLDSSNELGEPQWRHLYSASQLFGMKSQRPKDAYELVLRMVYDHDLFRNYQRVYSKGATAHYQECIYEDRICKLNYLCQIVKGDSSNNFNCEIVRQYLYGVRENPFNSGRSNMPNLIAMGFGMLILIFSKY